MMKIAIASGKGGTGKTTVATSLAHVAASDGRTVAYLDCDVEEPNGHLFLKPQIASGRADQQADPGRGSRSLHALRSVQPDLPLRGNCLRRTADVDLHGTLPLLRWLPVGLPRGRNPRGA